MSKDEARTRCTACGGEHGSVNVAIRCLQLEIVRLRGLLAIVSHVNTKENRK